MQSLCLGARYLSGMVRKKTPDRIFCGIDPGKSGALVFIGEDLDVRLVVEKMPWVNERIDSRALYQLFASAGGDVHVICEKVHSMPRDSSKSAFTFGGAYHGLLSVVDLFDYPLGLVAPQTWKKVMLRDRGKEKKDSVNAARDLFPALRTHLKTLSTHGTAEAALIAAYGVRLWKQEK